MAALFISISKDLKKFIKEILLFSSIVLFIVVIINRIYIENKPKDEDFTDKFNDVPIDIEICNFGSSHGLYGFNYIDLEDEYTCFNFALEAQYLSYDYRILVNYKDNLSKGATVIIPVSFNSFFGKDEIDLDSFKSKNKRYYKFLSKENIKNYEMNIDFYVNYLPSLSVDFNDLVEILFSKKENIDNWNKKMSKEEALEKAYSRAERQIGKEYIDENGNRIINETEVKALKDILSICKELELNPVLVTTPFAIDFIDAVNEIDIDFLDEFHSLINEICDEYNINYYDYSKDERFIYEYSYFFDIDHLNRKGAKEFTNTIYYELIK